VTSEPHATTVLDASALVALMYEEAGADRVERAIDEGALVSAINWAEVLTRLVVHGGDPHQAAATALPGGPTTKLELVDYDERQARETAKLIRYTHSFGLSLADRAALALGTLRGLPVLTADRAWKSLRLPIKIEVIR
jgi:PIN domain nuclease of toxin-antitoxin system